MITYDWRGLPVPDRSAAWGEEIARLRAAHDEANRQRDLLAAALSAPTGSPGGDGSCPRCCGTGWIETRGDCRRCHGTGKSGPSAEDGTPC